MSEKPDLKMLISQLAKYEAEFLSSSNIKNNCPEFAIAASQGVQSTG
ncbi:hypothetical protein A0O36_02858 [Piscirickettsiaceae bacterium NZ-RLO1]|nr:hypothetical protein A0O36_02858 [Piscirickettsiaceae bacterium NZ-RLO1]